MKPWISITLILFLSPSVMAVTAKVSVMKKGEQALADGLWEMAELHFKEHLADADLGPEAKSHLAIRLAEAMVRAGNPAEALELLSQSFVVKNPETPFWRAQALAAQKRFSEAIEIFAVLLLDPKAPHRIEAGLTQASLLLALGQAPTALETLATLLPEADSATAVAIQLTQVEILLDLKRSEDARKAMPAINQITKKTRARASFLEAQLLLRENKAAKAEPKFRELLDQPQGQLTLLFHSAAIGLADAIQAQGKPDEASKFLLGFLQDYPDSPRLDSIFERLLQWLPEKPTTTHPSLERIALWITPSPLMTSGLIATTPTKAGTDILSAWPNDDDPAQPNERLAHCLYAYAVGLHRVGTPEAVAKSKLLLHRLRVEYPAHPLAQRALYQTARWLLDSGASEHALALLDTLRDGDTPSQLKGEAAFLQAHVANQKGDISQAIQRFDEAAQILKNQEAKAAMRHAAIARLRNGDLKGILSAEDARDSEFEMDLELEAALCATPASDSLKAIEEFLRHFPDHSRAEEARLAAAEIALTLTPPDPAVAQIHLKGLPESPENGLAARIALARLRLSDFTNKPDETIAAAQKLIETYPSTTAASEAALTLGRNLFQSGSYHPARLVLEKLAATESKPARAQVAWLLAARAAALGGTSQSKDESLILFDKAIEAKGSVSAIASLEKARQLIDMNRLAEASDFLGKWMLTLSANSPLQLPAGLLRGEALYAQGSSNPQSLVDALAVYDKLLIHAKNQPALLNRLQYLRGTTLEQLPDEKDPSRKREKQAIQAYLSVLETTKTPKEWNYFERCGFRALALIERAERWQVAVTVAKKIASFNGPRAEEAASHARKLQLKYVIWED